MMACDWVRLSGQRLCNGITASHDFPITQGALIEANNNPNGVAFVTKVSPNGQGAADLVYSTFFGGQTANSLLTPDLGQGIAVAGTNAYITGEMSSPDMPVTSGVFQSALGATGAVNAFIAQLPMSTDDFGIPDQPRFWDPTRWQTVAAQFVTLTNNTSSSDRPDAAATIGAPNAADFSVAAGAKPVQSSLAGGASCTVAVTFTPPQSAEDPLQCNIPDTADTAAYPISGRAHGNGQQHRIGARTLYAYQFHFPGQLLTKQVRPDGLA